MPFSPALAALEKLFPDTPLALEANKKKRTPVPVRGGPKFAAKPHNPGFGMGGPMHNEVPPPPNIRGRGRGGNIRGRGRGRGFGGANHGGGYMNAGAGYGSYGYSSNSATAGYSQFYSNGGHSGNAGGGGSGGGGGSSSYSSYYQGDSYNSPVPPKHAGKKPLHGGQQKASYSSGYQSHQGQQQPYNQSQYSSYGTPQGKQKGYGHGLELLCEKSIGTANRPMGAGEALRRVLECLASGIVMPDGSGIYDPCEKEATDAIGHLDRQQREDITQSAQHALRLAAFGQLHKVLGMDPLPSKMPKKPKNENPVDYTVQIPPSTTYAITPMKRPMEEDGEEKSPSKKKKKIQKKEEKADPPQAMNALMRLNQLKPGLQYKLISQTGPVHAPIFTMSAKDGNTGKIVEVLVTPRNCHNLKR